MTTGTPSKSAAYPLSEEIKYSKNACAVAKLSVFLLIPMTPGAPTGILVVPFKVVGNGANLMLSSESFNA